MSQRGQVPARQRRRREALRAERVRRRAELGEPVLRVLVEGREVALEAGADELVERLLGQLELRARERRAEHHEIRAHPQQLGEERGAEPRGNVLQGVERDDDRERLVRERERGAVGEQEPAEVRARDVADHQLVLGQERLERARAAADLEHERARRHREALEQLAVTW